MADPPHAARWCLAPLHFPSGLHFGRDHRCILTWALVARRARAKWVGLHVVIGPKILWGFLFHNLSDSVIRRYFPHQECSLR